MNAEIILEFAQLTSFRRVAVKAGHSGPGCWLGFLSEYVQLISLFVLSFGGNSS